VNALLRPLDDDLEKPSVVWRPLPGSQALAMAAPPSWTVLYEGTRGPGKTDCQLMRFRRNVGRGYGRFWRGMIIDREYKNLDDLVQKSQRWFPEFNDGCRWMSSKSDYKWVWPTGEELLFRVLKKPNDYWNYHGHEYPYLGWNELTKYMNPDLYEAMQSTNRSSFMPMLHSPVDSETGEMNVLPPIPLETFATTNPYGIGHGWVKRMFIDTAEPGVPVVTEVSVFNPRTQTRETIKRYQVRIFGSYKENVMLDPLYIAGLESIVDENKRKAWLHGDWDIVAGGALDDVWKRDVHVKPRFKVPHGWKISRSFDWGSTHPFSVGWWAETNGEEVRLPDGTKFRPQPKSLIRIAEWYGSKGASPDGESGKVGFNEGVKFSSKTIALGIKLIEAKMIKEGWITSAPRPGPADNQIRDVREKDVPTIEKKMKDLGVEWTDSDKSAGSRKISLQLLRDRFEASTEGEGRGIYFMDNCKVTIAILPTLPRDEEEMDDVDTDAEDHPYDDIRYKVLESDADLAKDLRTLRTF
jgi:hypothetical protein